jgi:hypothetical protein
MRRVVLKHEMTRIVLDHEQRMFYLGRAKEPDSQIWYRYLPKAEQKRQGKPDQIGGPVIVCKENDPQESSFRALLEASPSFKTAIDISNQQVKLKPQRARSDADSRLAAEIKRTIIDINENSEPPPTRYLLVKLRPSQRPTSKKIPARPLADLRDCPSLASMKSSAESTASQPKSKPTSNGGPSQRPVATASLHQSGAPNTPQAVTSRRSAVQGATKIESSGSPSPGKPAKARTSGARPPTPASAIPNGSSQPRTRSPLPASARKRRNPTVQVESEALLKKVRTIPRTDTSSGALPVEPPTSNTVPRTDEYPTVLPVDGPPKQCRSTNG